MKTLIVLVMLAASAAAQTNAPLSFTNLQGKVYQGVRLVGTNKTEIVFRHGGAVGFFAEKFTNLPPALAERWAYVEPPAVQKEAAPLKLTPLNAPRVYADLTVAVNRAIAAKNFNGDGWANLVAMIEEAKEDSKEQWISLLPAVARAEEISKQDTSKAEYQVKLTHDIQRGALLDQLKQLSQEEGARRRAAINKSQNDEIEKIRGEKEVWKKKAIAAAQQADERKRMHMQFDELYKRALKAQIGQ